MRHQKKCEYCGDEFIAKNRAAKFCSDSCRVSSHLAKKKLANSGNRPKTAYESLIAYKKQSQTQPDPTVPGGGNLNLKTGPEANFEKKIHPSALELLRAFPILAKNLKTILSVSAALSLVLTTIAIYQALKIREIEKKAEFFKFKMNRTYSISSEETQKKMRQWAENTQLVENEFSKYMKRK